MVAATTMAGIFTRLFTSGMQRAGSMLFQKIMRLRKIDAAIKAAERQNDLVTKAINDLEIIIGS